MNDKELSKIANKYQAEQRLPEVVWFYRQCEKIKPKVIVEIGIKEGGNLKVLSTLLPKDGICVGIDPRKEIPWKMNDAECVVHHISLSSHSEVAKSTLLDILGGQKIDVLFIDGDHTKEGMLKDYTDYSPIVRSGGLVAVHDIYYLKEVTEAWNSIEHPNKLESPKCTRSEPTHLGIGVIIKE